MYNYRGLPLDLLRAFLDNGADVNKDDKDSQSKSPDLSDLCSSLTISRATVRDLLDWKHRSGQDVAGAWS